MNLISLPAGIYGVAAASTAPILCKPNTTVAEIVVEVNNHPPYRGSEPYYYSIIMCTRTVNGGPPTASAQPAEFGYLHTYNDKGPPAIPAGAPAIGTLGPAGGPLVSGGGLLGGILVNWGGGCMRVGGVRVGGCISTGDFLRVGRGVGVADCAGAAEGSFFGMSRGAGVGDSGGTRAGRFFGMSRGAGVRDSAGVGAGYFLVARRGTAVGDPVGAGVGPFFCMRCGAAVGDHVGAEVAVGGARGYLRLRLPGTGGRIIIGTGNGLTAAGSRTGVASDLATRAAALCLSLADSALALADPWLAGMYTGSAVGAPISGSRSTGSIAIYGLFAANAALASAMASHIACLDFRTFFATSCIS